MKKSYAQTDSERAEIECQCDLQVRSTGNPIGYGQQQRLGVSAFALTRLRSHNSSSSGNPIRNLLFRPRIPEIIPLSRSRARRKEHLCRKSQRLPHESPAIRYCPCLARLIESPRRQFLRPLSSCLWDYAQRRQPISLPAAATTRSCLTSPPTVCASNVLPPATARPGCGPLDGVVEASPFALHSTRG